MSVIRIKHNKENPYVTINKEALWNPKLSLKAIGLWAKCLSRPDDWRFNVTEMAHNGLEGRRAIYSALDELIEHNYALKIKHFERENEGGVFKSGGVEYVVFEFAATEEEKDLVREEFKKSFRQCGFGNCRDGNVRGAPLLSKEEEPCKEREYQATPDGVDLVKFFLENILQENPNFKQPLSLKTWHRDIDRIISLDKRSVEDIRNVIKWCTHNLFWKANVLSIEKLRKNFDQLWMKMQAENVSKGVTSSARLPKDQVLKEMEIRLLPEIKQGIIVVGHNYVEFIRGPFCEHINVSDNGFYDQLECNLRKMNKNTEWLRKL